MKQNFSYLKTLLKATTAAAVCLTLASVLTLADTIRLKDGSVFKGKVTSYNQRKFTITIYVGSSASQHVIPVEEIESVEFDGETGATAAAKPAAVEPAPLRVEKPKFETPTTIPIVRPADPPVNAAPANAPLATAPNVGKVEPLTAEPIPVNPTPTPMPMPATDAVALAEKTVNIAAAADWTSTEIRIQRGQRIHITASGEIDLGTKGRTGPNGISANDPKKLVPAQPTGGLIAVVGDDNNDFVFIGVEGEFVAKQNGVLFLSVNEEKLEDNRGSFVARVKVLAR